MDLQRRRGELSSLMIPTGRSEVAVTPVNDYEG